MQDYLFGYTVSNRDKNNRMFIPAKMAKHLGFPEEKNVICMENDGFFSIYSTSYLSSLPLNELEQKAPLMEEAKLDNQRRMIIKKRFLADIDKTESVLMIFGRANHIDVVFRSNLEKYLNINKSKEIKNNKYLTKEINEIIKIKQKSK